MPSQSRRRIVISWVCRRAADSWPTSVPGRPTRDCKPITGEREVLAGMPVRFTAASGVGLPSTIETQPGRVAPSDPRPTGPHDVMQALVSIRGLAPNEAWRWCKAWEEHAARRGLQCETPYFWDSARGWIDAQLEVAPSELKRQSQLRLRDVAAAQQRTHRGSRRHRALLEEQARLESRLTSLSGLDDFALTQHETDSSAVRPARADGAHQASR